jgi:ATP phosphoribosyltransferase regulatory subunit
MRYKSISEELEASKFRKTVEREMEDYFESKGFNIIEPDMFQSSDDFIQSNLRQDTSKTVKVLSGDSRIYILRPDITTNILGKIFSKWEGKPPLKVYYNSKVFKNTSGGRITENHQMGLSP